MRRARGLLLVLGLAAGAAWLLLQPMVNAAAAGDGVGQEMLINGDFSQGLTGWTHAGALDINSAWVPRGNGYGRACWTSGGCNVIYQQFYVWPGDYQLSFYIPTISNFGVSIWSDEQRSQLFFQPQNLAGGQVNSRVFTVETAGMYWLSVYTGAGQGEWVSDISIVALSPNPNAQPPAAAGAGYCTFTTTITTTVSTITGTLDITQTATYSRAANLLINPSFELAALGRPIGWQATAATASGAATISDDLTWWQSGGGYDGDRYASTAGRGIIADVPLYAAGNYVAGVYAVCPGSGCQDSISVVWGGSTVAQGVPGTEWQPITGTRSSGGGSAWFELQFGGVGPVATLAADQAFIYPADENGDLLCEPEFYEPYNAAIDGLPPFPLPGGVIDIPLPTGGGAGVVCYSCSVPKNILSIGSWIGWLACIIKNLFSCSLRVWLLNVVNTIFSVWRVAYGLAAWLAASGQAGINWIGGWFVAAFDWIGQFVARLWAAFVELPRWLLQELLSSKLAQMAWQSLEWAGAILDVAMTMIRAIIDMINRVYTALIQFLRFLIEQFLIIRDAFTADPTIIDAQITGDIYAAGANDSKIFWLFLAAVSAVDWVVGEFGLSVVLVVVMGALWIGIMFWTLRLWHEILPI